MEYEDEDNVGTQPLDEPETPAAEDQGGQDGGGTEAPPEDAVEGVQPLTDDDIPEGGR